MFSYTYAACVRLMYALKGIKITVAIMTLKALLEIAHIIAGIELVVNVNHNHDVQ